MYVHSSLFTSFFPKIENVPEFNTQTVKKNLFFISLVFGVTNCTWRLCQSSYLTKNAPLCANTIMRTPVYSLKIRTLISKFVYTVFFETKKQSLINFCLSFPEHYLKRSCLIKNRDFDDFDRKSFIRICCTY
jgi:hypothetical protein